MRTVHSSSRLPGVGCLLLGGLPQCILGYQPPTPRSRHLPGPDPPGADTLLDQTPWEQTPPQADTPQSRHPPSRHPQADTPQSRYPPEQTPPCENITFATSLRTVKMKQKTRIWRESNVSVLNSEMKTTSCSWWVQWTLCRDNKESQMAPQWQI